MGEGGLVECVVVVGGKPVVLQMSERRAPDLPSGRGDVVVCSRCG